MDSRRLILSLGSMIDLSEYLLKSEAETLYVSLNMLNTKQDKLYSGVNIATINGQSILNSGNISITAGEGTLVYDFEPTKNSENLVNSGSIYTAINNLYTSVVNGTLSNKYNVDISGNSTTTDKVNYDILFESTTPNYDNITLSNNVSLYTFVEVYAQTSDGVAMYTKIYKPNGKTFSFEHLYLNGTSFVSQFKTYTISNNSITYNTTNCGQVSTTQNDKHNREQTNTIIGITDVLGYK